MAIGDCERKDKYSTWKPLGGLLPSKDDMNGDNISMTNPCQFLILLVADGVIGYRLELVCTYKNGNARHCAALLQLGASVKARLKHCRQTFW